MHLLYLDDAGPAGNASEQYLVLGGVSVFEAQSHCITQQLDTLAGSLNPGDPHGVEFHSGDTQYLDRIASKFDSEDGIVHGLAHKEPNNLNCMCIACLSRRSERA